MHDEITGRHQTATAKRIQVDLALQLVDAFAGGTRVHRFDCISGDAAHPTDRGLFVVMRKLHPYHSHAYDVPMNYAMFFTDDGKALHQYHGPAFDVVRACKTSISDWFGSHGCVRLKEADARLLYDWTPVGTSVHVF